MRPQPFFKFLRCLKSQRFHPANFIIKLKMVPDPLSLTPFPAVQPLSTMEDVDGYSDFAILTAKGRIIGHMPLYG